MQSVNRPIIRENLSIDTKLKKQVFNSLSIIFSFDALSGCYKVFAEQTKRLLKRELFPLCFVNLFISVLGSTLLKYLRLGSPQLISTINIDVLNCTSQLVKSPFIVKYAPFIPKGVISSVFNNYCSKYNTLPLVYLLFSVSTNGICCRVFISSSLFHL